MVARANTGTADRGGHELMTEKRAIELDPDEIRNEGMRLLDAIAAEFKSDPQSVQCFDLRIVQRTIEVADEYRARASRLARFGL